MAPVDENLKKEEKKLDDADKHGDEIKPVSKGTGSVMDHVLDTNDDDKGDEYDEEFEENGHHYKKHVKKGPGYRQVQISSDEPMDIG